MQAAFSYVFCSLFSNISLHTDYGKNIALKQVKKYEK